MEVEKIKKLLDRVSKTIEKSEEIARLKQEDFNIFSILRKEHDEEHLHSAFLAELLNCNGSHGFGTVFCKLFVEMFCKGEFDVDNTVKVITEKHTVDLGRIDIYLENEKNQKIAIENKIHAGDQYQQLKRYHEHLNGNGKLFYLTLDGTDPSDESKGDLESTVHYECLSYRNDIIDWLQACLKEAVNHATVRETIKQYVVLLKRLTNQLLNKELDNEILEIILTEDESLNKVKLIEDHIVEFEKYINTNNDSKVDNYIFNLLSNAEYLKAAKVVKAKKSDVYKYLLSTKVNCLIASLIKVGINNLVEIERANRGGDGFFIKIKTYQISNKSYDLVLHFELGNEKYFFCIVEDGKKRNPQINKYDIFNDIHNELCEHLDNEYKISRTGYAIGKSEKFVIKHQKGKEWLYQNNEEIYTQVSENVKKIINKINSN